VHQTMTIMPTTSVKHTAITSLMHCVHFCWCRVAQFPRTERCDNVTRQANKFIQRPINRTSTGSVFQHDITETLGLHLHPVYTVFSDVFGQY
jgi:hypothetical protein